nr:cytidylate kinase-like family protein [Oscillospiraceae bacterium]
MVITISREYGAGGHSIGKCVAAELGVEFYDRDIIRDTVKESGLDVGEVEKAEEEITRTAIFLRAISPAAYADQQDYVSNIERHVILRLAARGPCVLLGRCAD